MRKKIVSLFLVLVLTMSFGSVAFASTEIIDDPGIDTHDTDAIMTERLQIPAVNRWIPDRRQCLSGLKYH